MGGRGSGGAYFKRTLENIIIYNNNDGIHKRNGGKRWRIEGERVLTVGDDEHEGSDGGRLVPRSWETSRTLLMVGSRVEKLVIPRPRAAGGGLTGAQTADSPASPG